MALERSWNAVQQSFTANGTQDGLVTVADSSGFYVKQYIQISSNTQPTLSLEVKRVNGANSIFVGPIPSPTNKSNLAARTDVSAYLVADNALILAPEQTIPPIRPDDIENYIYEREPVKAHRSVLVDQHGDFFTVTNPLSTNLSNGTDETSISVNGDLSVSDGLHSGGIQGSLVLTTANTSYEAKVGSSRLANIKSLTIFAQSKNIFWGYNSSVTPATGTPLFINQFIEFSLNPEDSNVQVWVVSSNSNSSVLITESP